MTIPRTYYGLKSCTSFLTSQYLNKRKRRDGADRAHDQAMHGDCFYKPPDTNFVILAAIMTNTLGRASASDGLLQR
eukprot:TRINITY_DN9696_c0_g1_i1.p2 TRINITY_DN9696_c0_g1~~TRINITY_DN9696_c0_g1_i1.p2  ORF type:complete len:76 (-),score=3.46 TRINITY_DN9696_c0_g1_i1:140-367(-)